jgi:hypothetical protein
MHTAILAGSIAAGVFCLAASCGERGAPSRAEQADARRARDAELLALAYPASSGVQPRTLEVLYDGANDRTTMTLRLTGMRTSGGTPVSAVTLHLTSMHKGRIRPADDPEGSVDGRIVVQTSSPGILAYSGAPGRFIIDGQPTPLREPSGKGGYTSARIPGGAEESVRFRFPTEQLIAAAQSSSFSLSFGKMEIEVAGQQLADLREFAARLNPRP